MKAIADAFVSEGLQAVGYQYLVVDYCWMQGRNSSGAMNPVASKFPSGMKALGDYIHGKGLKFGMYQSPTKVTCCGEPGSYQHEVADAQQFASWGVDFLKYDWCGVQSNENGHVTVADVEGRYTAMRDALAATQRPIVYAMCEKGQGTKIAPAPWSEPVGNMWRTGNDIGASWDRVLKSFDVVLDLGQYAKPGGWNDPDILEVGNGGMTEAENRAHFSLWAIVAAPLMMGNDPSNMTAPVKAILTNAEVIAVDQDPLGKAGKRVAQSGQTEVWAKPMQDGSTAVVLFNRGPAAAMVSVSWDLLGINGAATVRDLWARTDKGSVSGSYSASVASHDVVVVRIYPPGVVPGSGAGGSAGSGGAVASGGADAAGSGGSSAAGGNSEIGGNAESGGLSSTAGSPNGGVQSVGGTQPAGGSGGAVEQSSAGNASSDSNSDGAGCACNLSSRRESYFGPALGILAAFLLSRRRSG